MDSEVRLSVQIPAPQLNSDVALGMWFIILNYKMGLTMVSVRNLHG